tara:strand:+ start:249 stop:485 length:237 start_codon:yes stop_codon:yes gene_type:complete
MKLFCPLCGTALEYRTTRKSDLQEHVCINLQCRGYLFPFKVHNPNTTAFDPDVYGPTWFSFSISYIKVPSENNPNEYS